LNSGALSKEESAEYRCRSCGEKFDSLGDMQRHILVEHHQQGDIVDKKSEAEAA